MDYMKYLELKDKSALIEETKAVNEKLKGRFMLRIQQKLPMPKKIVQLANDPVAFHLHKKAQFF